MTDVPKWEVAWDAKQGRCYYFDRVTGQSTWMRPRGFEGEAPKVKDKDTTETSARPPVLIPDGWQAVFDNKEKKYFYYHAASGQRTWFKPSASMTERVVSHVRNVKQAIKEMKNDKDQKEERVESAFEKNATKKKNKTDLVAIMWDAKSFLHRIIELQSDGNNEVALRCALSEVKASNDDHIKFKRLHVPDTLHVSYYECVQALRNNEVQSYRLDPAVSMSRRDTASAINFFAQDQRRVVCALNFASGRIEKVGSEYASVYNRSDPRVYQLDSNDNQEEDLCRRIALLYSSLEIASKRGLYPFGPSTCEDITRPEKYRDVLFTPYAERDLDSDREQKGLFMTRGPKEEGFPILPEDKFRRCCIVSASPPCILEQAVMQADKLDNKLLFETITSIFVAPVLKEPRCTTIILGAWGCGSRYGLPATKIATLFAQALVRTLPEIDVCLGKLYHEVHFAIPGEKSEGSNYWNFHKVLSQSGIHVEEL